MRLFLDGQWFDPVPLGAVYEYEFEQVLLNHKDDLFPGFLGAQFDPLLVTPLGNVKPDLILVDGEYRNIFLVEVELASHSLTRHVRPQIEKIEAARLRDEEARWLATREPSFNEERLKTLFRDVAHATVLLTNAPTPHWDEGLLSFPAVHRAVIEVFRSSLNRTILRVNGSQPQVPGDVLSDLSHGSGYMSGAYRIDVPSSIDTTTTSIVAMLNGESHSFRVKKFGQEHFMFPRPSRDLPSGRARLLKDSTGTYRIEVIE